MAAIPRLVFPRKVTRHSAIERLARHRPMNEPLPFMSNCPSCGHWCLQDGYARRVLLRLLNTNTKVDAYCVECNAFWAISSEERHAIAVWLSE
jgi:hypothetical protein